MYTKARLLIIAASILVVLGILIGMDMERPKFTLTECNERPSENKEKSFHLPDSAWPKALEMYRFRLEGPKPDSFDVDAYRKVRPNDLLYVNGDNDWLMIWTDSPTQDFMGIRFKPAEK